MRFIKTFLPFGFVFVLIALMLTHLNDNTYFMPCLLGVLG